MSAIVATPGLPLNVVAFLKMIQFSEGSDQYDDPYQVLVGGGYFTDFSKHPNTLVKISNDLYSTAAGAYQINKPTYDDLGMTDFSPESQDMGAIQLIKNNDAWQMVLSGDFSGAINNLGNVWASLPGSNYGQPTRSLNTLLAYINDAIESNPGKSGIGFLSLALITWLLIPKEIRKKLF